MVSTYIAVANNSFSFKQKLCFDFFRNYFFFFEWIPKFLFSIQKRKEKKINWKQLTWALIRLWICLAVEVGNSLLSTIILYISIYIRPFSYFFHPHSSSRVAPYIIYMPFIFTGYIVFVVHPPSSGRRSVQSPYNIRVDGAGGTSIHEFCRPSFRHLVSLFKRPVVRASN